MTMFDKGFYVINLIIEVDGQKVFEAPFCIDYFLTIEQLLNKQREISRLGVECYFEANDDDYMYYIERTNAFAISQKVPYNNVNAIRYKCVSNDNIKVECALCKHCLSCYDINPTVCPDFEVSERIIEYRKQQKGEKSTND